MSTIKAGLLATAVFAFSAAGQATADDANNEATRLDAISVTGLVSKLRVPLAEAPQSVTVIEAKEMARKGRHRCCAGGLPRVGWSTW